MDANGNGIWVQSNMQWTVCATSVGEVCDALWVMVGMGASRGSHLKETCGQRKRKREKSMILVGDRCVILFVHQNVQYKFLNILVVPGVG